MNRLLAWSVLVCVCVGPWARGDESAVAKEDAKNMQGSWKPVTAVMGGQPLPAHIVEAIKLVVTDGKYVVTIGDQRDEGTLELHPDKKPRSMDIVSTFAVNKGKKTPAIYELKGDTLRICYDMTRKAHPTEFKSPEGTRFFLVEYKREKP